MKKFRNWKLEIRNLKFRKGMSLMELIIYLALVAIVLVVVIDLSTNIVYSQAKNSKNSETQQSLNYLMDRITSSIENASAISGTYPGNTLSLTVGGSPIVYSLSSGVITISEQSQPAENLSSSSVTVSPSDGEQLFDKITNGSATTIKVNILLTLSQDSTVKQQATTTVLMRGK